MKLKRKPIGEKYDDEIEALYAQVERVPVRARSRDRAPASSSVPRPRASRATRSGGSPRAAHVAPALGRQQPVGQGVGRAGRRGSGPRVSSGNDGAAVRPEHAGDLAQVGGDVLVGRDVLEDAAR